MKEIVLAADLGGTNLRMAAVDREGKILHRTKHDTPKSDRADEIIAAIVEAASECLKSIKKKRLDKSLRSSRSGNSQCARRCYLKSSESSGTRRFPVFRNHFRRIKFTRSFGK